MVIDTFAKDNQLYKDFEDDEIWVSILVPSLDLSKEKL